MLAHIGGGRFVDVGRIVEFDADPALPDGPVQYRFPGDQWKRAVCGAQARELIRLMRERCVREQRAAGYDVAGYGPQAVAA